MTTDERSQSKVENMKSEMRCLRELQGCESIVTLEGFYMSDKQIHIVQEYVKDGCLLSHLMK